MTTSENLLNSVITGNAKQSAMEFKELLMNKLGSAIDTKRKEVAKSLFKKKD